MQKFLLWEVALALLLSEAGVMTQQQRQQNQQPPNCVCDGGSSGTTSMFGANNQNQFGGNAYQRAPGISSDPFGLASGQAEMIFCDNKGNQYRDLCKVANVLASDSSAGLRPCDMSTNQNGVRQASFGQTPTNMLLGMPSRESLNPSSLGSLGVTTVCLTNGSSVPANPVALAQALMMNQQLGIRCGTACPCRIECPSVTQPDQNPYWRNAMGSGQQVPDWQKPFGHGGSHSPLSPGMQRYGSQSGSGIMAWNSGNPNMNPPAGFNSMTNFQRPSNQYPSIAVNQGNAAFGQNVQSTAMSGQTMQNGNRFPSTQNGFSQQQQQISDFRSQSQMLPQNANFNAQNSGSSGRMFGQMEGQMNEMDQYSPQNGFSGVSGSGQQQNQFQIGQFYEPGMIVVSSDPTTTTMRSTTVRGSRVSG